MLEGFLKRLEQPEYIQVLINPLPVYGLAMGLIGLMIGLVLRKPRGAHRCLCPHPHRRCVRVANASLRSAGDS